MADAERTETAATGPRAFWSGTITFGLVSVPVDMYPAVRSTRVPMKMLSATGHPLKRRYTCSAEGTELDNEDLVRGYPVEDGQYVTVSDEELEALEPKKSRDIDLRRFVPEGALDPRLFERPYVLAPAGQSTKAYRLLADTMRRTGQVGIATFVMRGKEYLAAIFARGGLLCAETMRFVDEIRTPADIGLPPVQKAPSKLRKSMASALASLQSETLDEERLRDETAQRLLKLAEEKRAAGRDVIEVSEDAEQADQASADNIIDIMSLLKQRMNAARAEPAGAGDKPGLKKAQRRDASTARRRPEPDAELSKQSKHALYERAKALEIAGRSQMSKSELVEAIRAAS